MISPARFAQLQTLAGKNGLPSFTHDELNAWKAAREARRTVGGPFTVLVTGRDGCAGHILKATMPLLHAVTSGRVNFVEHPVGGEAVDRAGVTNPEQFPEVRFPVETWQAAMTCDAILFGAVGSDWDNPKKHPEVLPMLRPQWALMQLRLGFDLFANVRPSHFFPPLAHLSPLRPELIAGIEGITVVRELSRGLYAGEPKGYVQPDGSVDRKRPTDEAVDAMRYNADEIRRVVRVAFELAKAKGCRVDSFDKENALVVGKLWRDVVQEVAQEFPEVPHVDWYVDIGLANLVTHLAEFGVIVTENMFGDISGDLLGALTVGSIGMIPSAGYGDGAWPNYFEPVHGSAPKRFPASGLLQDSIVNPLATILSGAMMLRSLGLRREADAVETGVLRTLEAGYRTYDICRDRPGETRVNTVAMAEKVRVETLKVLENAA